MWRLRGLACAAACALVASLAACGGEPAPTAACPTSSERPAATVPPAGGSGPGALRWRVALDTCTETTPPAAIAVGRDRTLVAEGAVLRAVDTRSGAVRWRAALPGASPGVRRQWLVQEVDGVAMVVDIETRSRGAGSERRLSLLGFDAAGGARRYDQILQGWGEGEAGVRFLFPGYDLGPKVAGAVEEDGNRLSLLDPTTGLPRWTATLPPVENAFWTVRSDGRTLYAQPTQPSTTDRIPRIDLATGRLLPPLVLGGGPTDAELWGLIGPLLLFEGSEGAFAVRAGDGTVAWRIPPGGAPQDHLSRYDDILGTIDPVSRLSVSARRDGRGFAVYDLDTGAWLGRRSGDWYSDSPVDVTRDGRLTVITTGATARVTCRDASGRPLWRSPVLPGWDLAGDDGYLTASGGLIASLECTDRPGGDGCASFDLVAVQV